jgi:hypothetical protein
LVRAVSSRRTAQALNELLGQRHDVALYGAFDRRAARDLRILRDEYYQTNRDIAVRIWKSASASSEYDGLTEPHR